MKCDSNVKKLLQYYVSLAFHDSYHFEEMTVIPTMHLAIVYGSADNYFDSCRGIGVTHILSIEYAENVCGVVRIGRNDSWTYMAYGDTHLDTMDKLVYNVISFLSNYIGFTVVDWSTYIVPRNWRKDLIK